VVAAVQDLLAPLADQVAAAVETPLVALVVVGQRGKVFRVVLARRPPIPLIMVVAAAAALALWETMARALLAARGALEAPQP
jgi:galactitol-specific phosphotransferase system IIC component